MNIETIDFILGVIFLFAAIKGILAGVWRELVSLLSLILAFVAGRLFGTRLAELLQDQFTRNTDVSLNQTIAFVVIFLSVWATLNILSSLLHRFSMVGAGRTGGRITGGILALTKSAVVLSVVLAGIVSLPQDKLGVGDSVEKSSYAGYLVAMTPILYDMVASVLPPSGSMHGVPFESLRAKVNEKTQVSRMDVLP
ncbi:CvpA family protein [Chrysiogenes arsenatis]|uniref:CvpA family protein n=1 Tax=Chrysiogenes arsenatis TaxID=309797 RepID=UPI0003F64673|nr:CvpA family protein [Chrysiogenes arsenatis]